MTESIKIPDTWVVAALPDVANINPTMDKSDISDDLEVSFVPMPAVEAESGKIDVSQIKKFSEVKKGYTPFQKNDVLFAKITPCMENGKMGVVPNLRNGIGFGSTEFHVLRVYDGIDSRFLYYFVSSKAFRYDAEHNMSGAVGQKRVPTTYIEKSAIPLPPTNEQKRIVAKIEELFSELDKGIESLKTVRAQLKVYRQAVLKHAFEGKLTANWRKENGASEEWKNLPLQHVIEEPRYGTSKKCEYDVPGVGVLRIPNIVSGVVDSADLKFAEFNEDEIESYALRQGDILTVRSNGSISIVGKCALIRSQDEGFLYAGYLIRIRPIESRILPEFLAHLLSSHALRIQIENKAKSTSGVNNINAKEIKSLVIPLCGIQEQEEVVNTLRQRLSIIDNIEQTIDAELQKSEALRQSILKKAFSGKLVPQNENDEPASIFLEKIRIKKGQQSIKPKAKEKSRAA